MAEENKDEQIEYEAKKPLLDAFRDLFKRPAALPGEIPSKHKTTNIDMRTSMSFREIRANIMKSVGDFFQSLSKFGAPKNEESPNKYMNNTQAKSGERIINNEEIVISQQPIVPTRVSPSNARTLAAEDLNVDTSAITDINKSNSEKDTFESDSSTDVTTIGTDLEQDSVQNVAPASKITTGTIVTGQPEQNNNRPRHTIKRKTSPENRDLEL